MNKDSVVGGGYLRKRGPTQATNLIFQIMIRRWTDGLYGSLRQVKVF